MCPTKLPHGCRTDAAALAQIPQRWLPPPSPSPSGSSRALTSTLSLNRNPEAWAGQSKVAHDQITFSYRQHPSRTSY